jgi:hypothetical protein
MEKSRLCIEMAQLEARPSFLDYIRGGCQLSFGVAVDFTGSNGDPKKKSSLHYFELPAGVPPPKAGALPPKVGLNDYQLAIQSVGFVLEYYDHDKVSQ